MSDLPAGWAEATVSDVAAAMFDGPFGSALKTSDYTDSGIRVARLENIAHLRFRDDLTSFISPEKFRSLIRYTLRAEDVLFSSFVDKQTRVCLVPADFDRRMINKADCFCVRVNPDACEPKFLAFTLAAPSSYQTFSSAVRGVTRPRIGLRDLAQFRVGLPPLAEQRRIVAKLDALTARTARARADLDRIPALAERYKQAVLASVFDRAAASGGLQRLEQVIESLDQGWSPKCDGEPAGSTEWGVIKTTAIQPIAYLQDENKRLPAHLVPRLSAEIVVGDVLVTRAGPRSRVGITCVVRETRSRLMLCDKAYRLKVRAGKCDPTYLAMMLNAPQSLDLIEEMKSGISDSGLNLTQGKFLSLPIPCTKLAEQRGLVEMVDRAFAETDRLVAEAAAARHLLDRLDQAILAKAFRGELVAQDPADEPASVLLERIRAERATSPAKARRGRSVAT